MDLELKPCPDPDCGANTELRFIGLMGFWSVGCVRCDIQSQQHDSPEEAIKEFNSIAIAKVPYVEPLFGGRVKTR